MIYMIYIYIYMTHIYIYTVYVDVSIFCNLKTKIPTSVEEFRRYIPSSEELQELTGPVQEEPSRWDMGGFPGGFLQNGSFLQILRFCCMKVVDNGNVHWCCVFSSICDVQEPSRFGQMKS